MIASDYFYKIVNSNNIEVCSNNMELSTEYETNNSNLLHQHTPNLNFIEHISNYTDHNPNLNYDVKQQDRLTPAIRGFKIASLNITSLVTHIDELRICMKDREIDVLAINETRMDDSVPIQSIAILGYTWISKNRSGAVGFFRERVN